MVSSTVEDLTLNTYYDTACTKLWWVGQFVVTATTSTTGTLVGSYTYYTQLGSVYEYIGGVTISIGPNYVSIGGNIATSQTASPYVNLGVGCTIATNSSSCTVAAVDHLATALLDEAAAATVSAALTTGASTTTVGINGTGAGHTGALNSLGLVPQGVSGWSVTGGSPSISVSLAGSVTYTSTSALSGESLTLADSADGVTVSMVYAAATQLITGTVVQTSTGGVVATFSVSATGTGTVTYGNGASGQIVNWAVQS